MTNKKNLSSKPDLEEIKNQFCYVNTEVSALKVENQQLKEKLDKVKKENVINKKDITWLESQIKTNRLFVRGLKIANNTEQAVEPIFKENSMFIRI